MESYLSLLCSQVPATRLHTEPDKSILFIEYLFKISFPSVFPTKTLYVPLHSYLRATYPAPHIILNLIDRLIFGEQYRS